MPNSARGAMSKTSRGAETLALPEKPASARGRPSSQGAMGRGDGSSTPLTRKAEQYYQDLMGARASSAGADTRQDWTLVQELDTQDHINREERKQRLDWERKKENQAALQQQLHTRNRVADECREVWRKWGDELTQDAENFKKEVEGKRDHILANQGKVREERERALEEARQRKAALKETERKLERDMMNKANEAKRRQDETDQKKKLESRHALQQLHVEVQKQAQERKVAKKVELEQDIKDQKQYEELLDSQERERGSYFKVIRAKQQKMTAKYEVEVGNKQAKMQADEDEKAQRQARERHEKERSDHDAQAKWRQQLRDSGRAAVQQQLDLQAEARVRQLEEEQRYLDQKQAEATVAEAKEADNVKRKHLQIQAHAEFLRQQIQDKQERGPKSKLAATQMNDTERRINRERLQRACDTNRADGLPMLLRRKRAEYVQIQREFPTSLPC